VQLRFIYLGGGARKKGKQQKQPTQGKIKHDSLKSKEKENMKETKREKRNQEKCEAHIGVVRWKVGRSATT